MVVRKPLKSIFFVFVFFLLCAFPVFAASSTFLAKAQNYYNNNCNKRNISNQTSLECYVFDKVNELQTSLNSLTTRVTNTENKNTSQDQKILDLESKNASQDAEISDLKNKVNDLLNSVPTIITLASNLDVNGGNGPAVQIPSGYKSMKIENGLTGSLNGWSPQVSFDGGNTWYEQHRFGCGSTCATVTIPILGPLYRFSPGGGSGTVSSTVTLNKEPNAKVILFGQGANYPFTSAVFNATGYTKIVVTAGGGDNPQHLTSISLQGEESGGGFGQTDSASCDGGAQCTLKEMNLQNINYKVVINGNGTNALFGAILRP